MIDLTGKIALVTGGGRGVGRVICHRLADAGAEVILNCFHSYAEAKAVHAELTEKGATAHVIRASVARREQVDRMFDQIAEEHGRLDILVNNAASGKLAPIDELDEGDFAKALDTNLLGSFWCARRAADLMPPGGTIVNLSSIGADFVPDNYLSVGTSKAAVEALSRYLAAELAPRQIRVNTASCGLIQGDVAELFPDAAAMQAVNVANTPLGRLATPDDLAGVVLFLVSDLARWVTGQTVLADGGISLSNRALSPPRPGSGHAQSVVASPARPERPERPGSDDDAIAIVGMGLAVPGASSPEEYWDALVQGRDLMIEVPSERWDVDEFYSPDRAALDKTYSRHSGFITDFRPTERVRAELAAGATSEELTSLWLRHSLVEALDGVTLRPEDRVSFSVGYTADGSQHLEEALVLSGIESRIEKLLADKVSSSQRDGFRGALGRALRGRLTRAFQDPSALLPHQVGLRAMEGVLPPSTELLMVDTACSSSLYTVDLGFKSLRLGTCDVAVCGGSFALAPRGSVLFAKLGGLSPSGTVRALDRGNDGVLFSDGAGVLVLKRLSRARADGERVLAVISGIGSSSDGKGKAIYAPSPDGQRIAVERALEAAGVGDDELGLVIAHATGTPAGDLAEFENLRTSIGQRGQSDRSGQRPQPIAVTSNKSVVGHTGWAAGAVSLIEAVLALENEQVPAQHNFEAPPDEFHIDSCNLSIPTETTPWPRREAGPRVASVSGFGFGGTNAHVVLEELHPGRAPSAAAPSYADDPVVIVGRAAHVPELEGSDGVDAWLAGQGPAPARTFGSPYPIPPFQKVRIPPGTMRRLDRCQLMILEAVFALEGTLGRFWDEHRLTTGILAGHMGPTRSSTHYALRCHLDGLRQAVDAEPELAGWSGLDELWDELTAEVRALVPDSNEDSFPGIMPNVIPARVANYLDFKGLNMTVDAGFGSLLAAMESAGRYLRSGDLDLALVCGINGNSTDEVTRVVGELVPDRAADLELAEGAFLLALTRQSTAQQAGLPILGTLGRYATGDDVSSLTADRVVTCGTPDGRRRNYLGAEGGVAMFEALAGTGDTPAAATTAVVCTDPGLPGGQVALVIHAPTAGDRKGELIFHADTVDSPEGGELVRGDAAGGDPVVMPVATTITTAPTAAPAATAAGTAGNGAPGTGRDHTTHAAVTEASGAPAGANISSADGSGEVELLLRRHVERLVEVPGGTVREPVPGLPEGVLVLTDDASLLVDVEMPTGAAVLSTGPVPDNRYGWHQVTELTPEAVGALVDETSASVRHVRLVTNLAAIEPTEALGSPPARITDLHDLLFLVAQHRFDTLSQPGSSLVALLLGGLPGGTWHPLAGLFTGFVKSTSFEMDALVFTLVTDTTDPVAGLARVAEESALRRYIPVVGWDGEVRKLAILAEEPEDVDPAAQVPALDESSIVVSAGGARGITGEALKAIAAAYRPVVYVVGSNRLDDHPEHLLEAPEDELPTLKAQYLREGVARGEGSVAELNARFSRMLDARKARATLAEVARHSGAERVHYLPCDLRDRDAVEQTMARIVAAEGRIDLLIHSAGINRASSIPTKRLEDYRAVREIKVGGYHNLKHALRDTPPRLWCNFGSFAGVTGHDGEVDYAAGNDFLNTAASYCRTVLGRDEITFGWTWWGSVGLASDPIRHSFLTKRNLLTQMSSREGIHHLMTELIRPERAAVTVHVGQVEWDSMEDHWPGLTAAWRHLATEPQPAALIGPSTTSSDPTNEPGPGEPAARTTTTTPGGRTDETEPAGSATQPPPTPPGEPASPTATDGRATTTNPAKTAGHTETGPTELTDPTGSPNRLAPGPTGDGNGRSEPVLLGRRVRTTANGAVFERDFDRAHDRFLLDHLVDGQPTLPGTFVPEIAAEAAMALVPDRVPVAFEDLSFEAFLRLYDDRPQRKRIVAEVVSHDEQETVVAVRITTDVVSPGGVLLRADKLHFQATVRMRDALLPAPRWEPWDDGEDLEAVPDPYHIPNQGVHLTGAFVSTAATRRHPYGRRARYAPAVPADDPVLSRMVLPSVLLDGLARLCVLDTVDGDWLGVAAPSRIRRIDLYELHNDLELATAYPTLELYSTPRGLDVEDPTADNRCVAVAPDGHVVLHMSDLLGVVMGHVHRHTGEFVPTSQRRPAAALAGGA